MATGKFQAQAYWNPDATNVDLEFAPTASLTAESGVSISIWNAHSVTLNAGSILSTPGVAVDAGSITIASTGACTFGGKILANSLAVADIGGNAGNVTLQCDGITLPSTSVIEANGAGGGAFGTGGIVQLNAGTGPVLAVPGAKITTKGGGQLDVLSDADCTLGLTATMQDIFGAGGGAVTVDCGGNITLSDNTKLILATQKDAQFGTLDLTAGGMVQMGVAKIQDDGSDADAMGGDAISIAAGSGITLQKGAVITSKAKDFDGISVSLQADGACDISGKIIVDGVADGTYGLGSSGGAVSIECGGISLGASSVIEAKGAGFSNVDLGISPGLGGTIMLSDHELSTGPITALKGAKINAQGKGDLGGYISIVTESDCNLAATLQADAGTLSDGFGGTLGGDGGQIEIECGGNLILTSDAKVVAGSKKLALAGGVLVRTFGHCSVTAAQRCTIDSECPPAETCNITPVQHCSITQTTCTSNTDCPATEVCVQLQLDQTVIQNDGAILLGAPLIIELETAGALEIGGKVESSAIGAAGSIDIFSAGLTTGIKANVQSKSTGDIAGTVDIDATPGLCDISGRINVKGSAAKTLAAGGGQVSMTCGAGLNLNKSALIDASGSGNDGFGGLSSGGTINLTAQTGQAFLAGKLMAKGTGFGGSISVTGLGVMGTVDSTLDASGADPINPAGGSVSLQSLDSTGPNAPFTSGDVLVPKNVKAKGAAVGGTIQVEACNITIGDGSLLTTDALLGGENDVTAHKQLTILGNGKVSAVKNGTNHLIYGQDPAPATTNVLPTTSPVPQTFAPPNDCP